jgi:quercetin dioxygenase-like cupin family protein
MYGRLGSAAVEAWNLRSIEAPDGTRDPVVLHSNDEGRGVLIRIEPGGKLGDHQVKERAWVCVVEGSVRVEAGGDAVDAETGWLFSFDPDERHSLTSTEGARILLLLAPWPGSGHYRGGDRALS